MKGFKSVKVSELVPGNKYSVRHSFLGLLRDITYVGKFGNKYRFTFGELENKDNQFGLFSPKSNIKIYQEAV